MIRPIDQAERGEDHRQGSTRGPHELQLPSAAGTIRRFEEPVGSGPPSRSIQPQPAGLGELAVPATRPPRRHDGSGSYRGATRRDRRSDRQRDPPQGTHADWESGWGVHRERTPEDRAIAPAIVCKKGGSSVRRQDSGNRQDIASSPGGHVPWSASSSRGRRGSVSAGLWRCTRRSPTSWTSRCGSGWAVLPTATPGWGQQLIPHRAHAAPRLHETGGYR
jgi:hypothetical protein